MRTFLYRCNHKGPNHNIVISQDFILSAIIFFYFVWVCFLHELLVLGFHFKKTKFLGPLEYNFLLEIMSYWSLSMLKMR